MKEDLTNTEIDRTEQSGKLMKAMMIGALVGGAMAILVDTNTRRKVSSATKEMKETTVEAVKKVKENPAEIKQELQERVRTTSEAISEIMKDAQALYDKVNDTVIKPANHIGEESTELLSSVKEASAELKEIGEKVKEAGEEIAHPQPHAVSAGEDRTEAQGVRA